jgi:hypothetical protein
MATAKKVKKAQTGMSVGTRTTMDSKTGTYDKLDRFKTSQGDRYYRSTGKDLYNLEKQNSRKAMMNSADSVRYNTLTPEEKKYIASQENPKAKDGKWIQKAIKKPGALRAQLGAKPGKPIPAAKLAKAAKAKGKLGQRARLAMTLKKMKK